MQNQHKKNVGGEENVMQMVEWAGEGYARKAQKYAKIPVSYFARCQSRSANQILTQTHLLL